MNNNSISRRCCNIYIYIIYIYIYIYKKNNTDNIKKSFEDSCLLLKGEFLGVLLGALSARLLGIMLAGKGINRGWDGVIRAAYGSMGSFIIRSSKRK